MYGIVAILMKFTSLTMVPVALKQLVLQIGGMAFESQKHFQC